MDKLIREKQSALVTTIVCLLLGVGASIWQAYWPEPNVLASVLSIGFAFFFSGWAFGIYLFYKHPEPITDAGGSTNDAPMRRRD